MQRVIPNGLFFLGLFGEAPNSGTNFIKFDAKGGTEKGRAPNTMPLVIGRTRSTSWKEEARLYEMDVRRGTAPCTHVKVLCGTVNLNMNPILPASASLVTSSASTPISTPLSSPPSTPGPATQRSTAGKKRGAGFTSEEDGLLTKAWVRISEDAIVGSEQKGEVFYKAINDYYDATRPPHSTQRTVKSIERRVRKILSECLLLAVQRK